MRRPQLATALELRLQGESNAQIARSLGVAPANVRRAIHRALSDTASLDGIRVLRGSPVWRQLRSLWSSIRRRCHCSTHSLYESYGAKGVRVCEEWQDFTVFLAWCITSGYRPGFNISLRTPDRDFSPENCDWITREQRMANADRIGAPPRVLVTAFGETKGIEAWSRDPRCVVTAAAIKTRIDRGFHPEQAITAKRLDGTTSTATRPKAASPRRLVDWEEVLRLHLEEDRSVSAIASSLGFNYHTIRKGLAKLGVLHINDPSTDERERDRKIYKAWEGLISRCENPNDPAFQMNMRRRVRVHQAWRRFERFRDWSLANGYEPGAELRRHDTSKGYSPKNCAWIRPDIHVVGADADPPRPGHHWSIRAFGVSKGVNEWSA